MNVTRNRVKIERTEFYVELSILDIFAEPGQVADAVYGVAWRKILETYPYLRREDFTARTYERSSHVLLVGFFQANKRTEDYPAFLSKWGNDSPKMEKLLP